MTAIILKGREVAQKIAPELRQAVQAATEETGSAPALGLIQFGDFPDAALYAKSIHRVMEGLSIRVEHATFLKVADSASAQKEIRKLADDPSITGVLVLSPVPAPLIHADLVKSVPSASDVEGARGLLGGGPQGIFPPTALSIFELVKASGISIQGADAVVVGRSQIVGQPAAKLLLDAHATVTICHSRTRDLAKHISRADIVVAAVGKANIIKGDWIKTGAVVIDAAENTLDGKLTGDVEFDKAKENAGFITPVPAGVGPLTTTMLAKNLIALHRQKKGKS